jgi:O-antigen ligase
MTAADSAVADADEAIGWPRRRRPVVRRAIEVCFIVLFFATVLLAPIPLGANRDWAWSPIVILLGGLGVWHALGLGIRDGHALRAVELRFLIALLACFVVVLAMGFVQISSFVPPSWTSDLYARAAEVLGRPVTAIASLNADATRAVMMKIAACGVIFVIARATCRDRQRARLFLVLFLASAVLVTAYGLVMQATNGSCYVFNYSKRPDLAPPGRVYTCALSGTFVNSNSYATYAGMALVVALGLAFSPIESTRRRGSVVMQSVVSAWLTGPRAIYLAAVPFLFGGLLLSASRAGFAATVVGGLLLAVLLLRRRLPSRPVLAWMVVAVILVGAAFALIAGSAFFHKMATLAEDDLVGRFRLWQLTISAIEQSPWLGWGLGSFPDVYALIQPPDLQVVFDKVHSTPLEWLMDLGIPAGLCAFATVLIPLGICLSGCWRRRTDRYLPAVAVAVAAVAILHSTVDFSLQIPATGFAVSALLGMGWAQSFRRNE